MNIKDAKNEIIHTLAAYLKRIGNGAYTYPGTAAPDPSDWSFGNRKTAVMEQVAAECRVGLGGLHHHASYSSERRGLPKL